jgi:hypothetical protein
MTLIILAQHTLFELQRNSSSVIHYRRMTECTLKWTSSACLQILELSISIKTSGSTRGGANLKRRAILTLSGRYLQNVVRRTGGRTEGQFVDWC